MYRRRINNELKKSSWTTNEQGTEVIVNSMTRFILPTLYPLRCPTLMINNINHVDMIKTQLVKYTDFCKLCNLQIPCFCCSSILSAWCPSYTCKDIYKEYILYKKIILYLKVLHHLYKRSTPDIPDIVIKEIYSYLI